MPNKCYMCKTEEETSDHIFDRKRQRDILIEKKKYKKRMRNPLTKEN